MFSILESANILLLFFFSHSTAQLELLTSPEWPAWLH